MSKRKREINTNSPEWRKETPDSQKQNLNDLGQEMKVVLSKEDFDLFDKAEKKQTYFTNLLGEVSYQALQFEANRIKLYRQITESNESLNKIINQIKESYNIPAPARIVGLNEKDLSITATTNVVDWAKSIRNKESVSEQKNEEKTKVEGKEVKEEK